MPCPGGGPKDLPPGPWSVRKFALDEHLIVSFLRGDTGLVVQHLDLPADARVIGARPFGTDTHIFIQSASYEARTCQCDIPTIRVNFDLPAPAPDPEPEAEPEDEA
jgi:hypothetical protein